MLHEERQSSRQPIQGDQHFLSRCPCHCRIECWSYTLGPNDRKRTMPRMVERNENASATVKTGTTAALSPEVYAASASEAVMSTASSSREEKRRSRPADASGTETSSSASTKLAGHHNNLRRARPSGATIGGSSPSHTAPCAVVEGTMPLASEDEEGSSNRSSTAQKHTLTEIMRRAKDRQEHYLSDENTRDFLDGDCDGSDSSDLDKPTRQ